MSTEETYDDVIKDHIKMIMAHLEKDLKDAIDKRDVFSNYLIYTVIKDYIESLGELKGDLEKKKQMAHELYTRYMKAWEEMYGNTWNSSEDSQ